MHLCSGTIRAPQAEEKLSAGFEFEKQMKKFNDVELRRPSITYRRRRRRRRGSNGFCRDKTAFKPRKVGDRYFVLLVSPHVDGARARARRHMWT